MNDRRKVSCRLYTAGSNVHGCLGNGNRDDEGVQRTFVPIHYEYEHATEHEQQHQPMSRPNSDLEIKLNIDLDAPLSSCDGDGGHRRKNCLMASDETELMVNRNDDRHTQFNSSSALQEDTNFDLEDKYSHSHASCVSLNGTELVALSCGKQHSLLLSEQGEIYSWGLNRFGQLGIGQEPKYSVSDRDKLKNDKWEDNNLSRKADGTDFDNSYDDEEIFDSDSFFEDLFQPTRILPTADFTREYVTSIACGSYHSLCTTKTGVLYSWGSGHYGCTGHGDIDISRFEPTRVNEMYSYNGSYKTCDYFVGVAAGKYHSLALSVSGAIYSFGRGEEGQLGDGYKVSQSDENNLSPQSIHVRPRPGIVFHNADEKTGRKVIATMLSCAQGGNGSYAVSAEGTTFRWGSFSRECNQKTKDLSYSSKPLCVSFGPIKDNACNDYSSVIVSLSAGMSHFVCITRGGEGWAMGIAGAHLGAGPACNMNWFDIPTKMLLPGNVLVNGVCCGERHTLLSTSKGQILVCGDAAFGKLGLVGDDLEKASDPLQAVPKRIMLEEEGASKLGPIGSIRSSFKNPFTYATEKIVEVINQYKKDGHEIDYPYAVMEFDGKAIAINREVPDKGDDNEIDTLSYELEMDYFGNTTGDDDADDNIHLSKLHTETNSVKNVPISWKRRLSFEAQRKLNHGSRLVGGAISSSGAILSGVVSAVTRSKSVDNPRSGKSDLFYDSSQQTREESDHVGSFESCQDSFDGLAGRPTQELLLAAGSNHSCIFISRQSPNE